MAQQTILVGGMTCGHCKMHVEKALKTIPSVSSVDVSLQNGEAIVQAEKVIAPDVFKKTLSKIGYEYKGAKK